MAESHFIQVSVDINVSKLRISQSVGSISDGLDCGLSGEKGDLFSLQRLVIEPSQSFASHLVQKSCHVDDMVEFLEESR